MSDEQIPKIAPLDLLGPVHNQLPDKRPRLSASLAPVLGGVTLPELDYGYQRPTNQRHLDDRRYDCLAEKRVEGESVDTGRHPYDVGVDLGGLPESSIGIGLRQIPYLEIPDLFSSMGDVRTWLAGQYPKDQYPDIHKIVTEGNILSRMFSSTRLHAVLSSGTDRDGSSTLGGPDYETEIALANGLSAGQVTYVALGNPNRRNPNGSDSMILTSYGGSMVIYDPRKMVRLGNASNGFSAFVGHPRAAILGVIHSTHPRAGRIPTEEDLAAYRAFSDNRRATLNGE